MPETKVAVGLTEEQIQEIIRRKKLEELRIKNLSAKIETEGVTKYNSINDILYEINDFLHSEQQLVAYQYPQDIGPQSNRLPFNQVISRTRNIIGGSKRFLDDDKISNRLADEHDSIFQKRVEVLRYLVDINSDLEVFQKIQDDRYPHLDKNKYLLELIKILLTQLGYLYSRIDELQKLVEKNSKKKQEEENTILEAKS